MPCWPEGPAGLLSAQGASRAAEYPSADGMPPIGSSEGPTDSQSTQHWTKRRLHGRHNRNQGILIMADTKRLDSAKTYVGWAVKRLALMLFDGLAVYFFLLSGPGHPLYHREPVPAHRQ